MSCCEQALDHLASWICVRLLWVLISVRAGCRRSLIQSLAGAHHLEQELQGT